MLDVWMLWMLIVGLAIGAVAAWLVLVRLPREESDVNREERHSEATWISDTIEHHGGIAPASLVDEVLELHQAYLREPALRQDPAEAPPPSAPPAPPPAAPPGPTTPTPPGYPAPPIGSPVPPPGQAPLPPPGYPAPPPGQAPVPPGSPPATGR